MRTRSGCSYKNPQSGDLDSVNLFENLCNINTFCSPCNSNREICVETPQTKMSNEKFNVQPTPFSKKDAKSWFRQLEAIFTINAIDTEDKKFTFTQAFLDPSVITELDDFFVNPPTDCSYTALKEKIIAEYSNSKDADILQLLKDVKLGDQKPSQLLREIKAKARGQVNEDFLRTLFLNRLPADTCHILLASKEKLDSVADLADLMLEYQKQNSPQICAVSSAPAPSPSSSASPPQIFELLTSQIAKLNVVTSDLMVKISKLETEIASISRCRSRSRSPNQSPNRSRSQSRSNFKIPNGVNLCFYHYKFGTRANKCQNLNNGTRCSMAPSNNSGNFT